MTGSDLRSRTLRRSSVIALAACTMVFAAACSKSEPAPSPEPVQPRTVELTEANNDSTVTVGVGDTVTLRLASNPSTGYSWKVTEEPDAAVLESQGMTYEEPSSDAIGAGGTGVWTFKAAADGSTGIKMDYVGPGTDAEVGQSFAVTVQVGA